MIVTIKNIEYQCRTASKEDNKVILYLGEYDEFGKEKTCLFFDFKDEDIVGIDLLSKPTQLDEIQAQVTYTAMMTDTLMEA